MATSQIVPNVGSADWISLGAGPLVAEPLSGPCMFRIDDVKAPAGDRGEMVYPGAHFDARHTSTVWARTSAGQTSISVRPSQLSGGGGGGGTLPSNGVSTITLFCRADLANLTLAEINAVALVPLASVIVETTQYWPAVVVGAPKIKSTWINLPATDNVASTIAAHVSVGGFWCQVFEHETNALKLGAFGNWDENTLTGHAQEDTDGIQNAIDAAIYLKPAGRPDHINNCLIPSGIYGTNRTIRFGYGTPDFQYLNFNVYGENAGIPGQVPSPQYWAGGTLICPQFTNRSAVSTAGGRRSRIKFINLRGKNYTYNIAQQLHLNGMNGHDWTNRAAWLDPTIPTTAIGQTTAYCGFAFDPFSTPSAPSSPYPDDEVLPSYLTPTTQYNRSATNVVTLSHCSAFGFAVGAAHAPSGNTNNTDFIRYDDCSLTNNVVALSSGNQNCRSIVMNNCYLTACHTALDNHSFGRNGSNRMDAHLINCDFSYCYQVLDIVDGGGASGTVHLESCYSEIFHKLGKYHYDATATSEALMLTSSTFRTGPTTSYVGKYDCFLDLGRKGKAVIVGNLFEFGSGNPDGIINIRCDSRLVEWRENTVGPNTETVSYRKVALSACGGVVFTGRQSTGLPAEFTGGAAGNVFNYSDLTQLVINGVQEDYISNPQVSWRDRVLSIHAKMAMGRGHSVPFDVPYTELTFFKTVLSGKSLTGTTLVFTIGGRTDAQFKMFGPDVGDILTDHGDNGNNESCVFVVRARTGTTITAELITNYWKNGSNVVTLYTPFSLTNGSLRVHNCRRFVADNPIFADLSTGSAILTNAGPLNGDTTLMDTSIGVGDILYSPPMDENLVTATATNAEVSARSAAARTITLGAAPNRNLTAQKLPIWVRQPIANS